MRALAGLEVLEEAAAALSQDRLTPELRAAAEREAHRLAGAAGTFGFPAASEAARRLEWLLEGTEPLSPSSGVTAAQEVAALRTALGDVPVDRLDGA